MQQIKLDFHKVVFSNFQCALIDSRKLNNKCLKTEKGKNFHVLNSISVFKKRKTEVQYLICFLFAVLSFSISCICYSGIMERANYFFKTSYWPLHTCTCLNIFAVMADWNQVIMSSSNVTLYTFHIVQVSFEEFQFSPPLTQ